MAIEIFIATKVDNFLIRKVLKTIKVDLALSREILFTIFFKQRKYILGTLQAYPHCYLWTIIFMTSFMQFIITCFLVQYHHHILAHSKYINNLVGGGFRPKKCFYPLYTKYKGFIR